MRTCSAEDPVFRSYVDFEIRIRADHTMGYVVEVSSPGGDAHNNLILPTQDSAYQSLLDRIQTLDTDEALLTELGQLLFRSIFHGPIKDVYSRTQGLLTEDQGFRLRFNIDAALTDISQLPWEFIYDPDLGPLTMLDAPIVRYIPLPTLEPRGRTSLPLRVLITMALPSPTLEMKYELAEVCDALDRLKEQDLVTIHIEEHLTRSTLQRLLREHFHVWHFIGNGGITSDGSSETLVLEDTGGVGAPISAMDLRILLNRSGLQLVILDAGHNAQLITSSYRRIAPALIHAQIPAVVAMQSTVPHQTTRVFASEFYRTLIENYPIDACLTEGRKAILQIAGLSRPDWGIPVLYTRARDGRLFDFQTAPLVQRSSQSAAPQLPAESSSRPHLLSVEDAHVVLREYLVAVVDYCDQLPYRTLSGVHPLPTLSSIYVHQQPERQPIIDTVGDDSARGRDSVLPAALTIEQALEQDRDLLIEGVPGVGKSSITQHLAWNLASLYLHGEQYDLVPVRVSARGLASRSGSLSSCLHAQINLELDKRLHRALPVNIFERPPLPDSHWLVIVDGIDEIVSKAKRIELLRTIAWHTTQVDSGYRFIITTRPISETPYLTGSQFGHYVLRPFDQQQVIRFAKNWFVARPSGAPNAAESFLHVIAESRIADVTEVPLLLTMAALFYERNRSQQLPRGRAGIYERFVTMLLEDEESERGTREQYREIWQHRYGQDGANWADLLFNHRREVLEHCALERQHGSDGPFLDIAVRYIRTQGWVGSAVPSEWLLGQLGILVQRSGLVTEDGEDRVFLHETIREYLAAKVIARRSVPQDDQGRASIEKWNAAGWREVLLFLLGIWSEDGQDIVGIVDDLRQRGTQGLLFTGAVLADGVHIAPDETNRIIDNLLRRAHDMPFFEAHRHPNALDILQRLRGHSRVVTGLMSLIRDMTVESEVRTRAREALERLGRIDELLELMHDASVDQWVRAGTIEALVRLNQVERAMPVIQVVAQDVTQPSIVRWSAAKVLWQVGQTAEGIAILYTLATEQTVEGLVRIAAARILGTWCKLPEAILILDTMANNEAEEPWIRVEAAKTLADLGHVHAATAIIRALAFDFAGTPRLRQSAIEALGTLNQGEDLLLIARDATIDVNLRHEAVQALQKVTPTEAIINEVRTLSKNVTEEPVVRLAAAQTLNYVGVTEDAIATLCEVMDQASVDVDTRKAAARALGNIQHPTIVSLLRSRAHDHAIETVTRMLAVFGLEEMHYYDDLHILADTLSEDTWVRLTAAAALGRLGETEEAILVLRTLAGTPNLEGRLRLAIADNLGELRQVHEAAQLLQMLLDDPSIDSDLRDQVTDAWENLRQNSG